MTTLPSSLQTAGVEPEAVAVAPPILGAPRSIGSRKSGVLRLLSRLVLLCLVGALLHIALRDVPLIQIARVLGGLQPWQVALLLAADALIYSLVTVRWWIVVRSERPGLPFLPFVAVRIAVFAVSYVTVGPQIGGEPLQVLYLKSRHGISYTRAAGSVVMDKMFELFGNFVLLAFGLAAILRSGILAGFGSRLTLGLLLLGLLVSWPLIHLALLNRRIYPVSAVLALFGARITSRKMARFIRACEHLAAQFCQRHPRAMVTGILASVLAAAVTVSEYALITSFVHIGLPFWQLVTAWAAGWLSFLVPVPGGLGALEASQVAVLGAFGVPAAAAIGLTLIMRGRDLTIGAIGLLIAGILGRRP